MVMGVQPEQTTSTADQSGHIIERKTAYTINSGGSGWDHSHKAAETKGTNGFKA